MNEREKEFNRRLSKARREAFFVELRHRWRLSLVAVVFTLLLVTVLVVAVISPPPRFRGFVFGQSVSEFIPASKSRLPNLLVTVKLENGGVVSVSLPKGVADRPGARMKIAIYERGLGPFHIETASFDSYAEVANGN